MKVIAYPFAGGSSYSYASLARSHDYAWQTLDPPGRGYNIKQPLRHSIEEIVSALLEPTLLASAGHSYVLYGHSMGAYIALAMLDKLYELGASLPGCLILSGAAAPHCRQLQQHAELPKQEFQAWLASIGGITPEVMAEPQLMDLFEPVLRADIAAAETYVDGRRRSHRVPVRIVMGRHDTIASASAEAWLDCFQQAPEIHLFDGGHFFIFEHSKQLCALIR